VDERAGQLALRLRVGRLEEELAGHHHVDRHLAHPIGVEERLLRVAEQGRHRLILKHSTRVRPLSAIETRSLPEMPPA